ncbi:MAG: hypothetical protein J5I62_08370 [Flavobacteriales bacterium]|nr:hypothetical protein [Flavobacteriales bacterium]
MKTFALLLSAALPALAMAQAAPAGKPSAPSDTVRAAMHVIARHYGDSIVVRWAPGSSAAWLLANPEGYMFRRQVFRRGERNEFTLVDSSSTMLKPWPMELWARGIEATGDSLALIAAQMLHGKTMAFNSGRKGNSMAEILDKYTEQENRFAYALMAADQSRLAADGLALRMVDKHVQKGLHYLYTVRPVGGQAALRSDTGRVLLNDRQIHLPDTFPALNAVAGDRVIHLFWPEGGPLLPYSSYVVERANDGSNFKRLHHRPFISGQKRDPGMPQSVRYDDSVAVNYHKYTYRVSGIDAFGDLSLPSPPITVMAVDLTPPTAPVVTAIGNTPEGGIRFAWEKNEPEADLNGFMVGRGTNMDGPFEPLIKDLLPRDAREFTDRQPAPGVPNYYIVAAVDTAGNAGRSLPAYRSVDDRTPPAEPVGLAGNIDSLGRVSLSWRWNREPDLAGYRVFFSNSPHDVPTPAHGQMLSDTLFSDSTTLRTLTKHLYYQVIAYDRSMNASPPSDLLKLDRPDTIAPMPALIHDFSIGKNGVTIHWHPSASEDAVRQQVLRQADSTGTWQRMADLPPADSAYSDTTVVPGARYAYTLETFDAGGLSSGRSFPLRAYIPRSTGDAAIRGLKAELMQDSVVLAWAPPLKPVNYYILYRGQAGEGLRLACNIPGEKASYTDRSGGPGTSYAIKAVHADGSHSAVSEVVRVHKP